MQDTQGLFSRISFRVVASMKQTKSLASVVYFFFFLDPRVVFKCSHHKYPKYQGKEFDNHGYCLYHNLLWLIGPAIHFSL